MTEVSVDCVAAFFLAVTVGEHNAVTKSSPSVDGQFPFPNAVDGRDELPQVLPAIGARETAKKVIWPFVAGEKVKEQYYHARGKLLNRQSAFPNYREVSLASTVGFKVTDKPMQPFGHFQPNRGGRNEVLPCLGCFYPHIRGQFPESILVGLISLCLLFLPSASSRRTILAPISFGVCCLAGVSRNWRLLCSRFLLDRYGGEYRRRIRTGSESG